ncbi:MULTISPECIES: hypothetical protein [unclassified Rathayibacter]|uniref:hypothetical protein n=1 Tax=unclassified Rathayibacter TaxID=2609250 RepID=UPI000F4BCCA9|nr:MULTISPECIES: hypothetical protein [unclassified Rathayibacter]ROP44401.1 hypothetical protein EDF45_3867 [Rathayibacter sp. PhB186]ROS46931.1 hypothetical protein EDF44_3832 [Rathayibacter sp. PhB185]
MSTTLERQYRRLLHWYPRTWREEHEEALIGTLLDTADAENRTAPSPTEEWNLAWNGLATHFSRLSPGARTATLTIALGNAAFIGLALLALTAPTVTGGMTIAGPKADGQPDLVYVTNISQCLARDGWQSTPGGGGSVTINYLETQRVAFNTNLTACLTAYGHETP